MKFIKWIDNFLNQTTMYRVVLYYLSALWVIALACSIFKILPYSPISLFISLLVLLVSSYLTNKVFAYILKVPTNIESFYISAFILSLILPPAHTLAEYGIIALAGVFAMASKYIFAWKHKHILNPAATGVILTDLIFGQPASWWVGAVALVPFVILGGIFVIRKIKRLDLATSFFIATLLVTSFVAYTRGHPLLDTLHILLFYSPFFFFMFIMVTEPMTTPGTRFSRILYGGVLGVLYASPVHIGEFYLTPEMILILGNIFSYIIYPKKRITLELEKTVPLALDTTEFVFSTETPITFKPGQYLEWTLGHEKPDTRGNRRYFTIASSPTENKIRLGVKFYSNGSTFKNAFSNMKIGDTILASELAGDFVLPKDTNKKLVFIAGGIGITPFRSMTKYLIDKNEKRDIVLLYANKTMTDIAYKNIFDDASNTIGLKTTYVQGFVESHMITEIPDWNERTFYISGPPSLVDAVDKMLRELHVSQRKIKTDFFPGYA